MAPSSLEPAPPCYSFDDIAASGLAQLDMFQRNNGVSASGKLVAGAHEKSSIGRERVAGRRQLKA
jgi:hypothetical protein